MFTGLVETVGTLRQRGNGKLIIAPGKKWDDLLYGETYQKLLRTVGDYDACQSTKRRHVITYSDVSAIGAQGQKQLPAAVSGKNGKTDGFRDLRLVTGEIPENAKVRVILGFAPDETLDPSLLRVYLSARPCRYEGEAEPKSPRYPDMRYFAFVPETEERLPPVSIIELGLADGKQTLHWAEIEIEP